MAVLIDANIIIGFLKEDTLIVEKIRKYIENNIPIFTSTISIMRFIQESLLIYT